MKKYFPFLLLALILGTVTRAFTSCGKFLHKSSAEEDDEPISGPLGPAPNVTFKSLDGSEISLESLRGKVVLVNFWATWCEPCKIETPWMIEFQKKYGNKGFTILGVAMDDEGASVVGPLVAQNRSPIVIRHGQTQRGNSPAVEPLTNFHLYVPFGIPLR